MVVARHRCIAVPCLQHRARHSANWRRGHGQEVLREDVEDAGLLDGRADLLNHTGRCHRVPWVPRAHRRRPAESPSAASGSARQEVARWAERWFGLVDLSNIEPVSENDVHGVIHRIQYLESECTANAVAFEVDLGSAHIEALMTLLDALKGMVPRRSFSATPHSRSLEPSVDLALTTRSVWCYPRFPSRGRPVVSAPEHSLAICTVGAL